MISIKVWEFGNGRWHKIFTEDHEETKDEFKYFRVIQDGQKEFYNSVQDYKIHKSIKNLITVNGLVY
jgi:hypothetical protein